jgi:acetone carboxylase, beta subunit
LPFKGIITFPFAAAFSAFGCACLDYLHRYSRSTHLGLATNASDQDKRQVGEALTAVWDDLEKEARADLEREGHSTEALQIKPLVMMRYAGQLTDLECESPVRDARTPKALDRVVATWEALYERINSRVSKYAEAGYGIFEVGLLASVASVKPKISKQRLRNASPTKNAAKGKRSVYASGAWVDATIWEMERLQPGNVIAGPAIIEQSATTLVVPSSRSVRVDEYGFFRLD